MASGVLINSPTAALWSQNGSHTKGSTSQDTAATIRTLHGNLIQSCIIRFTIPSMNLPYVRQASAVRVFDHGVYRGTFVLALLIAAYTNQSASSLCAAVRSKHPELLFVPSPNLWRGLVISKHIDHVLTTPVYIAVDQKFVVLSDK